MIRRVAVALATLAVAGCTVTRADQDAAARELADASALLDVLDGRTAGTPQRCIAVPSGGPMIVGDALLYREGRRLWVNRPVGGCTSLGDDVITITEVQGGQLCRNDRFRTVQRGGGIPGPYCRFDDFVPYTER